jgi:predicted HTH transcriptional regulator
MTEDRLRAIFAEGGPHWLEEPSLTGLDSQEVVDLLDTQAFFELLKQPNPTDRAGVIDRLVRERMIDHVGSSYAIRRIGGPLLAKKLDHFPDLARKAPRVVAYTGTSKLDTRIDWTESRGYAVGFQGLVGHVMGQLPQNEVIENALRKRVKLLPEEAVRELIANALIHQDLTIGGASPMIEIYSNRVEISNPGEPIIPVERFIDGHQSRNERLADLIVAWTSARRKAAASTASSTRQRSISCRLRTFASVIAEPSSRSSAPSRSRRWTVMIGYEPAGSIAP